MFKSELDPKYTLDEIIYQSSAGTVYRAFNAESSDVMAVKLITGGNFSENIEETMRFSHDLDTLSRLSHHGLLKIIDQGYHFKDIYVVSEYADYPSLQELFHSGHKFTHAQILDIFIELTWTLSYLHNNKLLHRCIKPSHILINIDNDTFKAHDVKLIDCSEYHVKENLCLNKMESFQSLIYKSPEELDADAETVEAGSDLYSLGAVMYRVCTNNPPFNGEILSDIIHAKITQLPPGPASVNGSIPVMLDRIIMKLLNSNPKNRYHTADGLLEDLYNVKSGRENFIPGLIDKSYRLSFHTSFIGREHELEQLKDAYSRAMDTRGGLCLVGGNPGVGKTRFIHEFSENLSEGEGIFLRGKCYCFEKNDPYSPFKEALDRYLEKYAAYSTEKKEKVNDHMRRSAGGLGEILIRFNPSLYEIMGDSPILVKVDPDQEKKRVLYALSQFFLSLAQVEQGLVLFLDDLQWLDDDGFDLLHEIVYGIGGYTFFIIGTYRDNEIEDGHRLNRFLHKTISENHSLTILKLKSLTKESVIRFIEELFLDSSENIQHIAELIYRKNRGNPFYTIEAVRELVEKGTVFFHKRWQFREDDLDVFHDESEKEAIEQIVKSITLLSEKEHALLSCAALSGIRFSQELLKEYGASLKKPVSMTVVRKTIDKAMNLNLIENDQRRQGYYIFTHDRIQESIALEIFPEVRRELHIFIADFIESRCSDSLEDYYYDLVSHFIYVGDEEKILFYCHLAGLKAKNNYAFDEAVIYFENALDIMKKMKMHGSNLWLECAEHLAELYLIIEEIEKSIKAYEQLIEFTGNKKDIIHAYERIAFAYLLKSINYKQAEKYVKTGLSLLGEKLPLSKWFMPFHVIKELARRLLYISFPGIFTQQQPKEDEHYEMVIAFYHILYWIYSMYDKLKFSRSVLYAINLCERKAGPSKALGKATAVYGLLLIALGRKKTALKYLQRSLHMRESFEDIAGAADSYYLTGIYYQWTGNYERCLECLNKSLDLYTWIGSQKDVSTILLIIHRIYIDLGEYEKALTYIHELRSLGYKMKNMYSVFSSLLHHAMVHFQQGDYNRALDILKEGLDIGIAEKAEKLQCSAYFRLSAVYLELGDLDRSLECALKAEELYKFTQPLTYYSSELFCRAAEAYIAKYKTQKDTLKNRERRKLLKMADRYTRKAMRIPGKWPTHKGDALRLRAEYYALRGKTAKAGELFHVSIDHYLQMNIRYGLAMSYYSYGNFRNSLNKKDASELLHQAYLIFNELGSESYAQKLRTALKIDDESSISIVKSSKEFKYSEALKTLMQTINNINSSTSRKQVLENIRTAILKVSGAQRVFFFIKNEDTDDSLTSIKFGENQNERETGLFIQKIAEETVAQQRIIHHHDILGKERFQDFHALMHIIKTLVSVPVRYRGHIKAVLYLDNRDYPFTLSDEILKILNTLSIQLLTDFILLPEEESDDFTDMSYERLNNICMNSGISNKEKEVLLLLLKGYTKKQIAREQSISINTVKHHISNIYSKTGRNSRDELADLFSIYDLSSN